MVGEYSWVAVFEDKVVRQIEGYTFGNDVLPFSSTLKLFFVTNGEHQYGVDLSSGDFIFDGARLADLNISMGKHVDVEYPVEGEKLRPIFFRRVLVKDLMGNPNEREIICAIGWQATVKIPVLNHGDKQWHEEERNTKHILYIHPNNRLVLT